MFTDKEKMVIEDNYEISKKLYLLLKEYRNYKVKKDYNYEDIFKKRNSNKNIVNNNDESSQKALVNIRETKFVQKIIEKIKNFFHIS